MNRLPFELVDKIFDLLPTKDICSLSLLNSYWNKFGTIKLYSHPLIKTEKELYIFKNISQKLQPHIRVLDLTAVHQHITDAILLPLLQHATNNNVNSLNTLILTDCTLSTKILHNIGEAIHFNLKKLNLSNTMIKPCVAIDTSNHLETMITLPYSSSQLIHLDLSYCSWVNSKTVENIANGLPNLNYIILQWCNVNPISVNFMLERLNHLKSIDIRHIDTFGSTEQAINIMDHTISLKNILLTCKRTTNILF